MNTINQMRDDPGEAIRKLKAERDAALAELDRVREASGALVDEIDPDEATSPGVQPVYSHEQMRVAVAEAAALRRERDELAAQVHIVTSERDELASGMQALRASRPTCDWPGKCAHKRPAQAAAQRGRAQALDEMARAIEAAR